MARWPLFPHPLHSRSSVGGNRMHEGSEPLSREIRASSAITRGTRGLFLGKIQFVLIHTWKAKGTKSLFSFIKYARRHSWNTDRSFWKAVPRSFLPSSWTQVCLKNNCTARDRRFHSKRRFRRAKVPEKPSTRHSTGWPSLLRQAPVSNPCSCRGKQGAQQHSLPAPPQPALLRWLQSS